MAEEGFVGVLCPAALPLTAIVTMVTQQQNRLICSVCTARQDTASIPLTAIVEDASTHDLLRHQHGHHVD
jgi:hypothetical protein